MLVGMPAIAATAFAGAPLAMNAMPGPLPMPISMPSAANRLLQPGVAAEGRWLDGQPLLAELAGLDADLDGREGPGERHGLADSQRLGRAGRRRQGRRGKHHEADRECADIRSHGFLPAAVAARPC